MEEQEKMIVFRDTDTISEEELEEGDSYREQEEMVVFKDTDTVSEEELREGDNYGKSGDTGVQK